MNLQSLREEDYAFANWTKLRPFYCSLSPEFIWSHVRAQIVEELNQEIQANASSTWEYATYFTYPTNEQMETIHHGGMFFSEIREIVGYRSAEALSVLAGLVRLEPEGDVRVLLEESFSNLWAEFSRYGYGHGFDTPNTRSDLVLMLARNNVFGMVRDREWIDRMREYFTTETHPWSQKPLRDSSHAELRVLGMDTPPDADSTNPAVTGVFNLGNEVTDLAGWQKQLHWDQGRPEEFDSAPPPSMFYRLPYHLVKFTSSGHLQRLEGQARDPFGRTCLHFLNTLCLRTSIARGMGIGKPFTRHKAAEACEGDGYAAIMTLGQMIKQGLATFDTAAPSFHDSTEFACTDAAKAII